MFSGKPISLSSLLVMAAAGMLVVACSGTANRASGVTPSVAQDAPTAVATQGKAPGTLAGEERPNGSSPAAAPTVFTAKDQGQGGITIKATWVVSGSPEAKSAQIDRYLAFVMSLDTHTVDLTQFDLIKLSLLRDDKGNEVTPAGWEGRGEDSHHRSGILRFPRGIEQESRYIELVIRNLGGAQERVLRWDIAD